MTLTHEQYQAAQAIATSQNITLTEAVSSLIDAGIRSNVSAVRKAAPDTPEADTAIDSLHQAIFGPMNR